MTSTWTKRNNSQQGQLEPAFDLCGSRAGFYFFHPWRMLSAGQVIHAFGRCAARRLFPATVMLAGHGDPVGGPATRAAGYVFLRVKWAWRDQRFRIQTVPVAVFANALITHLSVFLPAMMSVTFFVSWSTAACCSGVMQNQQRQIPTSPIGLTRNKTAPSPQALLPHTSHFTCRFSFRGFRSKG